MSCKRINHLVSPPSMILTMVVFLSPMEALLLGSNSSSWKVSGWICPGRVFGSIRMFFSVSPGLNFIVPERSKRWAFLVRHFIVAGLSWLRLRATGMVKVGADVVKFWVLFWNIITLGSGWNKIECEM